MQAKPLNWTLKGMRLASLAAIAMLVLAACSPASTTSPTAPAAPTTAATSAATATTAATTAPTVAATPAATSSTPAATSMATAAATTAATPAATSSTPQATMAGSQPAATVTLTVKTDAKLGNYLADDKGMTLYQYAKDVAGKSNCEGACLANWPALLVAQGGKVTVTGGDQTLVGTITRSDGTTQVTYRNLPLYYFIKDKAAGDTMGQGIGSVWFVVKP